MFQKCGRYGASARAIRAQGAGLGEECSQLQLAFPLRVGECFGDVSTLVEDHG